MRKERRTLYFLTVLFFLLWLPLLFPAFGSPDAQGYDYVDNNTSDVDTSPDKGSHSNFTAQQDGPDSTYDTLSEENTGAGGEITKIGTDTSGTGNSLTLSFSHTLVSGTARIVIVSIGIENGNTIDVSTVTYGGVTMTLAIEGITSTSGFRFLSEIWYILENDLPSDGSQTVEITCSGTASSLEVNGFCSEYIGVTQGAPEATAEHHQTTGTTITNDISPSDNAWVISAAGSGNAGSFTHGQGQVEVLDFADASSTFAVAELRGASGETSLDSTYSSGVNRLERVAASWTGAIEEDNYELDLEVQWANANYTQPNEELCIKTGTTGVEDIKVDVWTGSTWQNLFTDLSSGWNNVSVTDYLVSSTFTIRFKGGTETDDTSQDSWGIDCTLLHTWGFAPIANFTYTPANPYTGETLTFNASDSYDPDGTIANYSWDFDDGTNAIGVVVEHTYIDNGKYTVILTVTDNDGLTDTVSAIVLVSNSPPVASFIESAETVYTSETITFNASASYDPDGTIVEYFWDFSDGTNATGIVVTHSYVDDGVYMVTLTVTDDDESTDTASSVKTVLNRPPVASFTESSETVYTGETITFNASASYDPDGTISYIWDFDDGTNATGVAVEHFYVDDGVYTVTLTITDDDGATDTATSTKTVLNRSPIAIFTESAETAYIGEAITFNASDSYDLDGAIVSYFWDFGDETNATAVIVNHVYDINGTFTVTLTVTDDDGASDSASSTKTILMNEPPVALFTESAETVCTSEIITLNASNSYDQDGYIVTYFWDFGDGTNATGIVVDHSYVDDGLYTVTLTVTDDRDATSSTSASKTVLNRPPAASFTESAETIHTGEFIYFNASASYDPDGIIINYFWDFGDGTNTTGIIADHAYVNDGVYTVTLTVTDDDGATDTATSIKTILNRSPVASFTESAETVYTSEVITFNASASYDSDGSITNYFWDFGDASNATGVIVEHLYADDGNYTVILTITDDDGETASVSSTKTVLNRSPVPSFTESATIVLTGETIYFNASASYDPDGYIANYVWDFGDGENATGTIVEHSYVDDGNYTVTLTATDDDGATGTSTATKIVANRSPVASFTESAVTVLTSEIIYFNASSSYDPDGYIISYFWDFGDGTNASGMAVNYSYTDDGVYTVTLTVTDNNGATGTTTAIKTILNRPPVASFIESAETVYTGETIMFNASASYDPDGTIVSYFWDFGDGDNATGIVVSHAYTDDGNYTVILAVTDDDGTTDTTTSTKTILNRPPVASFTESAETVYTGETIYFNASSSYDSDGVVVNYFWDFGDGTNATGVAVDYAYSVNGTFAVTLTVTDDDQASALAQATKTILLGGTRDVAVVDVTPSSFDIYAGQILNVTVVVLNEGTIPETFDVTLYYGIVQGWHLVESDGRFVWYSGDRSASADFLLLTSIDVPIDNPVLTFDTKYDIEYLWDFGFVQISSDGGTTWSSLENAYTTHDHHAGTYPDIIASLPGLTGTSSDWPEWMNMTFDLTSYSGETVLLGFRYMTDAATQGNGWYIDNVRVNDTPIPNQALEQSDPPTFNAIQTYTISNLDPDSQANLDFTWNTTGITPNRYIIIANTTTLFGETDIADNRRTANPVNVKIWPDLDGDGDVDLYDAVKLLMRYGTKEGDPDYLSICDLNNDGQINLYDAVILLSHYGQSLE